MKKILLVLICFAALTGTRAQAFEVLQDPNNGNKMYRGFITDSLLKNDTTCKWYTEAQKVFAPKEKIVADIKKYTDSVHFVIFMGTWCEDSHFIVPRFYKTLEASNFNKSRITLIAVDRTKKEATGLASALNITNVPTIIAYKNGKELGRVKEYGNTGRYDEEIVDAIKKTK